MNATSSQRRVAAWIAVLFGLLVVLQRLSVPGLTNVSMLVPAVIGWMVLARLAGILEIDRTRLCWWLGFAGISALGMLVQQQLVDRAVISLTAWMLIVVVWLPFTMRAVDRSTATYLCLLRYVSWICSGLALLAVIMVGLQLLGVGYRDYVASFVPANLQLEGFVISYPITWGSPIFKANAWIGLEPSFVSAQLGVGLLAAVFVRARMWMILVLILGLIATVSGSGIVIVLVGLLVMVVHRSRVLLVRYAVIAVAAVGASLLTPFGAMLLERSTEFQGENTSTSLRALQPYEVLIPQWMTDPLGMLIGYGPGSSQRAVEATNVLGLLVPTPLKIFFEYGLIAGFVLAVFLLVCYWGGPSRTFSVTLLVSLWVLQPGSTTLTITLPLLVLVTLFSPRWGPPLETLDLAGRAADDTRRLVESR
ncbi:MAG TPA: hypothetical protein PKY70_14820 [Nakamurella multipartita]|nr:hypothetical protein [Nakamurella multipartita]